MQIYFLPHKNALEKTGLTINQIDLYEMNEVFTPPTSRLVECSRG